MIASLKRQGLYEVSIGLGKESYEYENDLLNDGDRDFGTICVIADFTTLGRSHFYGLPCPSIDFLTPLCH